MDIYQIIKEPLSTEKTTVQKSSFNKVSFKVQKRANKVEIRRAVEAIFNVKVLNIRTINVKGKKRRVGRSIGKTSDWKKAIVTLRPGQNMDIFEGV
ncbi:MAG: 50S ribosomal protein L23 [Deltaproteobacteria bacterium]|nr:50S ribosomal protein L23 [Deltaproteobacteria bacterium]